MKPRIVCAALELPSGRLIAGPRHYDAIMFSQLKLVGPTDQSAPHIQGFLDQLGKFYTREEAWKVAWKNGQVIRRVGGDGEKLFSENLY